MRSHSHALQTLADLVDRNAHLHAQELHRTFGETRNTFADYRSRSLCLASAAYGVGLRGQDRLAVLAMNCPEYMEIIGAAEVSPFIVAPINYRLAAPEIAYVANDAAPRLFFFEKQYEAVVDRLRPQLKGVGQFVCIGEQSPGWATPYEEFIASGSPNGPALRPQGSDIHAILYTSGTTGRPKGAMVTHEGMLGVSESWAFELAADLGDKILLVMPLFHIGARSQGTALTYRGGTLVIHRSFDAREVVKTIERDRITQVHLAPTLVQQVLDLPDIDQYDLSSIKTLNYAAAPMPITVLRRALKRFGRVMINGFGQTEGGGTCLRKRYHVPEGSERDLKRLTSIGQPIVDAKLRIVDDFDREVPIGTIGEICFMSCQTMLGYWNNTAASIETLRDGWLHTGDMGYADDEGFVYLADRKKDMIISGGENIYSREVEEALMAHPGLSDAAVIGVPDAKWGESVKAVVVLKAGIELTAAALIAYVRTLIAPYKCPKSVEFIAELPRLPSGKISKVVLRERYRSPM
jgi:acyl-CoA synthetase (AMP-forming)/AMP-acid ligase II